MALKQRTIGCVVLCISGAAFALGGCQSLNEATGGAKMTPDEFAVVTKQPLIIPPDFKLRPPSPGADDANSLTPAGEARAALFTDPQEQAAALGTSYSDSEKTLLTHSGGVSADPQIRHTISEETGYESDPALADKLLAQSPIAAPAPAPVPAQAPVPKPAAQTAPAEQAPAAEEGSFFDFLPF